MEEINLLEESIGGRWTGVAFHRSNTPINNLAKRPMRLCEAIKALNTRRVVLTQQLSDSENAQYRSEKAFD